MKNLSEMGLIELNRSEQIANEGGVIMMGLILMDVVKSCNWAYDQLKKGIYDGYAGK